MRFKKKWVFIFIFIYTITYCKLRYRLAPSDKNIFLFTSISTDYIAKNKFGYVFDEENGNNPQKIVLRIYNMFGGVSEVFSKENPPITDKKISFNTVPFWVKKIKVSSVVIIDSSSIEIEQVYTPYIEFGIYRFWSWYDIFIYSDPIPLIKIGGID